MESVPYKCKSILAVRQEMSDVVKKDSLAQHGLHSNLNTNLNNVISRYSQTNILKENKSSDVMHLQVFKRKPQVPNSIHKLDKDQSRLVLSSAHLLKQLLNKSVGFSPDDLREMQKHDTHLQKLIEKCNKNETINFT